MTCGSGGPNRRANATNCAGVSDLPAQHEHLARRRTRARARANARADSGCEMSTSRGLEAEARTQRLEFVIVRLPCSTASTRRWPPACQPTASPGSQAASLLQEFRPDQLAAAAAGSRGQTISIAEHQQHRHQHDHRVLERVAQADLGDRAGDHQAQAVRRRDEAEGERDDADDRERHRMHVAPTRPAAAASCRR